MARIRSSLFVLLVLISLIFSSVGALAQGQQPPRPPDPTYYSKMPVQPSNPNLHRHSLNELHGSPDEVAAVQENNGQAPQAAGGPDDFGYTWNDSVPYNWINATNGTKTGLVGDDEWIGPVNIGFDFKFYENTYANLYFNTNGLVTFGVGSYAFNNRAVPNPSLPNNFIAAFWEDLCVDYENFNNGAVYYKKGGTAPNRYFVIEWHEISFLEDDRLLTFEVILYENGDILIQYKNVIDALYTTIGIENALGSDGLSYYASSSSLSNKAVRFSRPAPSARVNIWPVHQGLFTQANGTAIFQVPIQNTGDQGADTYDLSYSSFWPVSLYRSDGTSPLIDSDGDTLVDTGSIDPGESISVTVKVQAPAIANVGSGNTVLLTARSSLNTARSKTAVLKTVVPAPFTQVYTDDAGGAMNLYLVKPSSQVLRQATGQGYHGFDVAVAESPTGNLLYAWNMGDCLDNNCNNYVEEIEYTLLDHSGNKIRAVSKLADLHSLDMDGYDNYPAITVAPDGRIGIVWAREYYNNSNDHFNYNVYFAILDAAGSPVYGPVNLTKNDTWGIWSDQGVPRFYTPQIAATGDNRFVLTWERYSRESNGTLENIYYTIRDTAGAQIKSITKFTSGVAGNLYYYGPSLATLNGNRVLLAYNNSNTGIVYAVLNSAGSVIKAEASTGSTGTGADAVQLSDGHIALAWTAGNPRFAILDGSTYNLTAGPTTLSNPAVFSYNAYVSIAADRSDHAILTWMDGDWSYRRNLYYALVDSNGSVVTQPMIFRSTELSQWGTYSINTGFTGYGNTSYTLVPTSPQVDAYLKAPNLAGAPPAGQAIIPISLGNDGAVTATSVILTATLDAKLTYMSDTSGIVPTKNGNQVVWSLPDLTSFGGGSFSLFVSVPNEPFGTQYTVKLEITSTEQDGDPANNTRTVKVMVSRMTFLPLTLR